MEENTKENTFQMLPAHPGRIFIRNLSFHCSDSDLQKLLQENNFAISEAKAFTSSPNNRNPSRKPMYYGYVELCDPQQIDRAMSTLNGKLFMGRHLSVQRYMPFHDHHHQHYSNDSIPPTELHSGIDERFSEHLTENEFGDRAYQLHVSFKAQTIGKRKLNEDHLRGLFQQFGNILDVIIKKHVYDAEKRLGGYAFIQFERDESAHDAICAMHNQIVDNIHFNCRRSKKHAIRSCSFDTTVASESPSLSVYYQPNVTNSYGVPPMNPNGPIPAPTGNMIFSPQNAVNGGTMMMVPRSYSGDEQYMLSMMSNAGMVPVPSFEGFVYGPGGRIARSASSDDASQSYNQESMNQQPPYHQQEQHSIQQFTGYYPHHAVMTPPQYYAQPTFFPMMPTGVQSLPFIPPPLLPPPLLPTSNNKSTNFPSVMPGFCHNSLAATDKRTYPQQTVPPTSSASTHTADNHHGGTDTENSPSQQFLHHSYPGDGHASDYSLTHNYHQQPPQQHQHSQQMLTSGRGSYYDSGVSGPHQPTRLFSPLPPSAVSAIAFVPRSHMNIYPTDQTARMSFSSPPQFQQQANSSTALPHNYGHYYSIQQQQQQHQQQQQEVQAKTTVYAQTASSVR